MSTHNLCFEQKYEKYQNFLYENFPFLVVKISVYLNRHGFIMVIIWCTCHITKTCLYDFDPLKPQFYIVKLRFTGVYIIFLISAQNIDCGYLLELPH